MSRKPVALIAGGGDDYRAFVEAGAGADHRHHRVEQAQIIAIGDERAGGDLARLPAHGDAVLHEGGEVEADRHGHHVRALADGPLQRLEQNLAAALAAVVQHLADQRLRHPARHADPRRSDIAAEEAGVDAGVEHAAADAFAGERAAAGADRRDAPAIALRLCACLLRARRDGREQDGRLTRATPATSGSLAVSCRSLSLSEVVSISGVGRSSGAGVSTERVASKVKSAGEGPERVV
jgi:hypothetical protein